MQQEAHPPLASEKEALYASFMAFLEGKAERPHPEKTAARQYKGGMTKEELLAMKVPFQRFIHCCIDVLMLWYMVQDEQMLVDCDLSTKGNWKVASSVIPKRWPDVSHRQHLTYEDGDWTMPINNEETVCTVGEAFVHVVNELIKRQLDGVDIHRWQKDKLFPRHLNQKDCCMHKEGKIINKFTYRYVPPSPHTPHDYLTHTHTHTIT